MEQNRDRIPAKSIRIIAVSAIVASILVGLFLRPLSSQLNHFEVALFRIGAVSAMQTSSRLYTCSLFSLNSGRLRVQFRNSIHASSSL
jgi:hypothetical protein